MFISIFRIRTWFVTAAFALISNAIMASPLFSITVFTDASYYSESLRVGSNGSPLLAGNPSSTGGIYAVSYNSHGTYVGTCMGNGLGVNFRACSYSATEGIKQIPFSFPTSTPPHAYATDAYDINENGDVLGGATYVNGGNINIGLQVYKSNGELIDLPGQSYRRPSINNSLEIVGSGILGGAFYAFNGASYPLEELITNLAGFHIRQATDINDFGYIAGIGVDSNGLSRGFILTRQGVVPEPGSLLLVTLALTSLITVMFFKIKMRVTTLDTLRKV